jgi:hypothetical protein
MLNDRSIGGIPKEVNRHRAWQRLKDRGRNAVKAVSSQHYNRVESGRHQSNGCLGSFPVKKLTLSWPAGRIISKDMGMWGIRDHVVKTQCQGSAGSDLDDRN